MKDETMIKLGRMCPQPLGEAIKEAAETIAEGLKEVAGSIDFLAERLSDAGTIRKGGGSK